MTRPGSGRTAAATFFLPYVAPYHWAAMLDFLAARAVPATEQISGATYRRSLQVQPPGGPVLSGTASVSDEPRRQALRVELSGGLAGGERSVIERIGRMFDVDCDPSAVAAVLGDLVGADRGLRLPGTVDPFEIAVRAILGQQVTVAAARTIATRFVAAFGPELTQPQDERGPTRLFPPPCAIAGLEVRQLGELGIIRSRGEAIIALARALSGGGLRLGAGAPVEPTLAALTAIRGIGPWTAHYIAMRALGWTDAFPPGDVVVLKALGVRSPAAAAALARRWQPWRSYAVLHLWRRSALRAT